MNTFKKFLLSILLIPLGTTAQFRTGFYDDVNFGTSDIDNVDEIGNWMSTHGSPSYRSGDFYIWYFDPFQAEGISYKYSFQPNTKYILRVGITSLAGDFPTGGFEVGLASNVTMTMTPYVGSAIPTFSPYRSLYSYNDVVFTDRDLFIHFETGPTEDFRFIVFKLKGARSCNFKLQCLSIRACNTSDLTISESTIPNRENFGNNVFVGSSYGSTASMTQTIPGFNTEIFANTKIEVAPGTTLAATGSEVVYLGIESMCSGPWGSPTSYFEPGACGILTRPGEAGENDENTLSLINETNIRCIKVFPNPSMDRKLKIDNSLLENVTYELYDLNGQLLDKGKISASMVAELNYETRTPGIYYLKFIYIGGTKTEKIVLQ